MEHDGKPLLGKGGAQILEQLKKQKSISKTAENLGMSYRYVWSYIRKIEKTMGKPIVKTCRGGKSGGGNTELTELGESLLREYKRMEKYLDEIMKQKKS